MSIASTGERFSAFVLVPLLWSVPVANEPNHSAPESDCPFEKSYRQIGGDGSVAQINAFVCRVHGTNLVCRTTDHQVRSPSADRTGGQRWQLLLQIDPGRQTPGAGAELPPTNRYHLGGGLVPWQGRSADRMM
jgi:hypothetical protein